MKNDRVYLIHILECIENIENYTLEGKSKFNESNLIQDAVIRNLYPKLPWREMAGLRDVLIHDYFGVDIKIVWNVVEKELPKIKEGMKQIMSNL